MHDLAKAAPGRVQGALSMSPRGSWRLGWLSLGDSVFAFHRPDGRASVRINLAAITSVDRERRPFILASKHVLRLTYRSARARPGTCWVITAWLGEWEAALRQRMSDRAGTPSGQLPVAASRQLAAGLAGLPATCALILDYLACRGHATTAELMGLIDAESEESLLAAMHGGFRQLESALGCPAIRYADRYFDAASRQVRRRTWHVSEGAAAGWLAFRAPTDVFLEDGELVVVTRVPTSARDTPPVARTAADGYGLVLRHGCGHDRWIDLPCRVAGQPRCAVSPDGTLVISGMRAIPPAPGEGRKQ